MLKKILPLFLIQTCLISGLYADSGTRRLQSLGFKMPLSTVSAPSLSAYLDNEKLELTDTDRVTILYFWSTSVPPSLTDLSGLNELNLAFSTEELTVAAVNLNEDASLARKAAKEAGMEGEIYLFPDPRQLKPYIHKTVPAAYILDKNGNIAASHQGNTLWSHPDIHRTLRELIQADPLLEEQSVPRP
ncbi:MAG: TlpA disulfide reductase family protein [Spirochaetales bacterium]|nr:TlpA disulfide reductase family protein [Spirochaetales bacterium]